MKGLTAFFLLALFSTPTFATSFPWDNTDPDDGDPANGLFDYANAVGTKETLGSVVPDCSGQGEMTISACYSLLEAEITQYVNDRGNGTSSRSILTGGFNRSVPNNQISVNHAYTNQIYYANATPPKWGDYSYSNRSASAATIEATIYSCPPEGKPYHIIKSYLGSVLFCFNVIDIGEKDSCPDDDEYGVDMLPVTSNTASRICALKPDGSRCEYNLNRSGTHYGSVPSRFCYQDETLPEYDAPSTEPTIDETGDACQDLGFGLPSCVEDPENVCDTNGQCNEGCGTISTSAGSAFVCLSEDEDGDGLANYLDPDIDGDGIKNEDDLDSNGDGLDDAKYGTAGSGGTNMKPTNNILEDILAELKNGGSGGGGDGTGANGSGLMPEYSEYAEQGEADLALYDRIKNSELVMAFASVATFINFGTGAECPILSVDLPDPINETVGTNIHCELMPTMSTIISPVMIAMYLFMGFRIFTSA